MHNIEFYCDWILTHFGPTEADEFREQCGNVSTMMESDASDLIYRLFGRSVRSFSGHDSRQLVMSV